MRRMASAAALVSESVHSRGRELAVGELVRVGFEPAHVVPHAAEHISASVAWRPEQTAFGFVGYHRTNLYHDRLLGVLARHIAERETMRQEIHRSLRLSA